MTNTNSTLITPEVYKVYKEMPVEHQNEYMQNQMNAYEAAHGFIEEAESVCVSLVVNDVQDLPTMEVQIFDPTSIEPDPVLMKNLQQAMKVNESQGLEFKYESYKIFFPIWSFSSIASKFTTNKVAVHINTPNVEGENPVGQKISNTFGLSTFAHLHSRTTDNKDVKKAQMAVNYITTCATMIDPLRNTKVTGFENVKTGNLLVVIPPNSNFEPNDDTYIAKFKDIFENEDAVLQGGNLDIFSSNIFGIRYHLRSWMDDNEEMLGNLIEQLKTIRPSQVKTETYHAWLGVLAIALLTNYEYFEQMWDLMLEQVGTQPLEAKVKLIGALSKIIPDYEKFLTSFHVGVEDNTVLPSTLLRSILGGIGYNISEMSEAFSDLGFPLKDYKGGVPLKILKAKCVALPMEDKRFKKYIESLK
ncbi:TPA: hypothetical protein JI121_15735 [Acinetobacter baumannii]|nr:hypothetical protein [Acinetobacter baumannii]HAV5585772.1 hypothetical protein [Acinetobacter baumannii]HAV5951729.1 hypothetical protein [Acinetobacter baumannii]